jgi:hypothetical protein
MHPSTESWKLVFLLPLVTTFGGKILFGFSFQLLKARDCLAVAGKVVLNLGCLHPVARVISYDIGF